MEGLQSGIKAIGSFAGYRESAAGVLTVLHTMVIPGRTLQYDGESIHFEYRGDFAGAAGTNLLLEFGGISIFSSGSITPAAGGWLVNGRIIRLGKTEQFWGVELLRTASGPFVTDTGTPGADLDVDNNLVLSASTDNLADISMNLALLDFRGLVR